MSQTDSSPDDSACRAGSVLWNVGNFALAVIAGGGSLYLSLGLGLKACPLCFYQRSFALGAVLVLAMLFVRDGVRSSSFGLVTLPLALGGLGIAGFHVYLVQTGVLECPPALFGLGDGPMQSLAIFGLLTIGSLGGTLSALRAEHRNAIPAVAAAILLGAGAAWASIASSPPLPPQPTKAYDPVKQPFDMCRPPFREKSL
jgi:hypothetical protein